MGVMRQWLATSLIRSRDAVARAITLSRRVERVGHSAAAAIAFLAIALALASLPSPALAHATERGFVLLLPTEYYLAGGTAAVAVSFLLLFLVPGRIIERVVAGRIPLFPIPSWLPVATSACSFLLMVALIAAGLAGTRDPLENPLPLAVWTLWWVCLTIAHALVGDLWAGLNPWTAPYRLLCALGWRRGANGAPLLRYPEWLGYWPSVIGLLAFAGFELIDLAPDNPPRLACAIAIYWAVAFFGMLLFGEKAWRARGECFSVFFGFVASLAPLRCERAGPDSEVAGAGSSGNGRLVLGCPGAGALALGVLPPGAVAFVLLTLATVSFDGFSKTFVWLATIGINPLEFPGRSAVMLEDSLGLLGFWLMLGAAYSGCMLLGNRLAGRPLSNSTILGTFALSVLPISIGYHFSHYLTATLVNAQYALASFGDPFARGWNLLGLADRHVTTSFLATYDGVAVIWKLQAGGVVLGHIVAVALAHAIAVARIGEPRRALACQMPLAMLMVAYTLFGLWLLAAPTAG